MERLFFLFVIFLVLFYFYIVNRKIKSVTFQKKQIRDELELLQKQQTFFIKKMIHEMNTPLSAIELNVSVLLKENPSSINIQMIKGSARILATIYDDIAFLARRERLCYPAEWIDLGEFIADRVLYFDAMTRVKNIVIEINIDDGFTLFVGKTQLQRLIDNNLSNAIKYTREDNQIITISVAIVEDGLCLTFEDNGIGMSEHEKERLFEAYYQGSAHHCGLGLGMSIIKDVCDEYGISIEVRSIKGRGSSFDYKFPKEIVSKASTVS